MKCLIVAFHSASMTPYSKLYEDALREQNIDYDIVYWDRFTNGTLEKVNNIYIIHKVCGLGGNKFKKIIPMYYFRRTLLNIISDGAYDKIVILNTLPGVLLSDVLCKKYKNRYIFDIRDYTYEKYRWYRRIVDNLIDKSYFSTISSEGFRNFLNVSHKLYLNHNISNIDALVKSCDKNLSNKLEYVIGYVGVVRFQKENIILLKSLDSLKYTFCYHGHINVTCKLKEYCEDNGFKNVSFKGDFNNCDKPEIYAGIDIINSMYANDNINGKNCLPNRLYDALLYKKPIIVPKGTYCASLVRKYNLGIAIGETDDVETILDDYLRKFNYLEFNYAANRLLKDILNDQNFLRKKLYLFLFE